MSESIRQACTTCNLHKRGGPPRGGGGGVPAASPVVKSISFEEKNRDISLLGFLFSFIFSLSFLGWSFSLFIMGDPDKLPC